MPRFRVVPLSVLLAPLLSANGCAGLNTGGLGGLACPALAGGDPLSMHFSANARANAKIRTFVAAAKDLSTISLQMEAMAADACLRMGRDLGVPEAQMAPSSSNQGARAQAACGAVSGAIDWVLRQGVQVSVRVTPPHCEANADARARCNGACNVELDPGEIVARCAPGQLSGQCVGECQGRCDGNCGGDCQGVCSARDATGRCVGRCEGTCRGNCGGICHTSCNGQWQAPRCAGQVTPPSADADCRASCDAHANVQASCTRPTVEVAGAEQVELGARLIATLRANLPDLVFAEVALGRRLLADVRAVVRVGQDLPRVVGDAGAEGLACIAAATNASVEASVRIDVSVQASANVAGRVGAS